MNGNGTSQAKTGFKKDQVQRHIEVDKSLINLMLNSRAAIEKLLELGLAVEWFDPVHKNIVDAILMEYESTGCLISRDNYRRMLLDAGLKGDVMLRLSVWDKCSFVLGLVCIEDLGMYYRELKNNFLARKMHSYLYEFGEEVKKSGYLQATTSLIEKADSAVGLTDIRPGIERERISVSQYKDEYLAWLTTPRKESVLSGYPEIDERIPGGFTPGHMTIFCAPPGHHKTNMMINLALRMMKQGHAVWYFNLEDSSNHIISRMIAHETKLPLSKILKKELAPDELEQVADCFGKLAIEVFSPTASVSVRYIERLLRVSRQKPRVIIVDYQNCLAPLTQRVQRNDLEIGETLKELRRMGKRYGFAAITAAQLGRDAIRRWRKESSATPDTADLLGSQQYGADADCIFALRQDEADAHALKVWTIKARYGIRTPFDLHVDATTCRITSGQDASGITGACDVEAEGW